ncbi:MAG: PD40 domain-containing protein [Armatimonadota bacterium]|nr:MAG: PD40 domain-containing protein [Armatimonadota bacterium]
MRLLTLIFSAVLLVAMGPANAEAGAPPADLGLVYAITETAEGAWRTSIYLRGAGPGPARLLYRDTGEKDQILTKIAGSDLVGSAHTVPPRDIYVMMGEATAADLTTCADALCRLRIADKAEEQDEPEPLLVIPLCFSDASPYGLRNRAPIFAVSADGERIALQALRAGDVRFTRPAIRVLASGGREEWRIALEEQDLYVADLAWSPDGKSLAYLVMPQGDVHTLDEALLPRAGLYLADLEARTTRLVYRCYGRALAWGPRPDLITVAARARDIWDEVYLAQVVVRSGKKVEEFSLPPRAVALSYSDDGRWLAVQSAQGDRQQIWLYPSPEGWGRLFHQVPQQEGRMSLLGWVRSSGPGTEP